MTGVVLVSNGCRREGGGGDGKRSKGEEERENQISLIALLLAAIRRSMVSCRMDRQAEDVVPTIQQMEIGWPTDVQHVAHVTFDRFHGFLGLPVEFELEVPSRAPSASASVFGVSAESMQCCYDSKGNSVPTILLLMQDRLYLQGGLKAEGIFRINPENSQEENVREQLNKGIVPDDIDLHCLAGLIKAWFRELPEGVLDCLSPQQVLQCNSEDECVELVKQLLPTQAALLNWAVELMADVVEEEEVNKMNARNIAMVFAPNMTQMSDPLTALMHAVQVMNLLKTLILKTLREREEAAMGGYSPFSSSPSSDQQGGDDSDSQQDMDVSSELRDNSTDDDHDSYSQPDVDVNGELRGSISDDDRRMNYSSRCEDVDVNGELRGSISDDDCHMNYSNHCGDEEESEEEIEECFLRQLEWKELPRNLGEDCSSCQSSSHVDQATQPTFSGSNVGSLLSIPESKLGSLSTSDETHSEASINRDVACGRKRSSKHVEDGEEVEMVGCKWNP